MKNYLSIKLVGMQSNRDGIGANEHRCEGVNAHMNT